MIVNAEVRNHRVAIRAFEDDGRVCKPLADIPGLMARGELMGSGTLVALLHILASRGKQGLTTAH
jgi:hypothetical protein